jgi:hypothetical protein
MSGQLQQEKHLVRSGSHVWAATAGKAPGPLRESSLGSNKNEVFPYRVDSLATPFDSS